MIGKEGLLFIIKTYYKMISQSLITTNYQLFHKQISKQSLLYCLNQISYSQIQMLKLYELKYCIMTTTKSMKNLTREELSNYFQSTLLKIFNDRQKVILLSKTFRIFPSFFNSQILTKMLNNSEDIEYYFEYVQKYKKKQPIKNVEFKNIINRLELNKLSDQRVLQCYINYLRRNQNLVQSDNLMEIFDIRNPQNWFGLTRGYDRHFIYHHGPTNSGKTFSAINQLRSLRQDQKGVYMAPLRLLAWEAQQKLGKCNLITGQQKDYQNSHLTACTIEACKPDEEYEVAIVDQIQMIEDSERGWAWTNKILGLRAKRIHLCGDERALGLISKLIDKSGGTFEEKTYSRLSKLHLIKKNFRLGNLLPGDCMIDFSSSKLYAHRRKINHKLSKDQQSYQNQTAIIYGKMPPSSRKKQAHLFNEGKLPYLVATNAIGMGLNLMIRRIIFTNLLKMSSSGFERILEDHEIRQIAGRAGRGMGHGYVICSNSQIRKTVTRALKNVNLTIDQKDPTSENGEIESNTEENGEIQSKTVENEENFEGQKEEEKKYFDKNLNRYLSQDQTKISRAALFFPYPIIERIKMKIENLIGKKIKLGDTIQLIGSLSQQNKDLYFIQKTDRLIRLCQKLQSLQLPLAYQFLFAGMPINSNLSGKLFNSIIKYAEEFKIKGKVQIPPQILEQSENDFQNLKSIKDIQILEKQYIQLQAYTWLANHLQLYFLHNVQAEDLKQRICLKIDDILMNNPGQLKKETKKAQKNQGSQ